MPGFVHISLFSLFIPFGKTLSVQYIPQASRFVHSISPGVFDIKTTVYCQMPVKHHTQLLGIMWFRWKLANVLMSAHISYQSSRYKLCYWQMISMISVEASGCFTFTRLYHETGRFAQKTKNKNVCVLYINCHQSLFFMSLLRKKIHLLIFSWIHLLLASFVPLYGRYAS